MRPKTGLFLISYGVLLLVFCFLAQGLEWKFTKTAFVCIFAGGILCILWGALARADKSYRAWTVLTLGFISYVLLTQVVVGWLEPTEPGKTSHFGPACMTVLLLFSLGLASYILHFEQTSDKEPANGAKSKEFAAPVPAKQIPAIRQKEARGLANPRKPITFSEARK